MREREREKKSKKKLKREFEGNELLFKVLRKRCRALNHQKHVSFFLSFFFFTFGQNKETTTTKKRA